MGSKRRYDRAAGKPLLSGPCSHAPETLVPVLVIELYVLSDMSLSYLPISHFPSPMSISVFSPSSPGLLTCRRFLSRIRADFPSAASSQTGPLPLQGDTRSQYHSTPAPGHSFSQYFRRGGRACYGVIPMWPRGRCQCCFLSLSPDHRRNRTPLPRDLTNQPTNCLLVVFELSHLPRLQIGTVEPASCNRSNAIVRNIQERVVTRLPVWDRLCPACPANSLLPPVQRQVVRAIKQAANQHNNTLIWSAPVSIPLPRPAPLVPLVLVLSVGSARLAGGK